jgi:CPA2 family monovalent cation:H+ antiporter-2
LHDLDLILTISVGLAAALVLGALTNRLRLSPILGYLLAGIAVGPHTPGFVADASLAAQLAEIGVVLLMFGVGLHFHWKDLVDVRSVAVPGAIGQSLVASALGVALAVSSGWTPGEGLILGIGLSVASTVVLVCGLEGSGRLDGLPGRVAVGWLVVEDVLTVLVLVLLPALATTGGSGPLADPASRSVGSRFSPPWCCSREAGRSRGCSSRRRGRARGSSSRSPSSSRRSRSRRRRRSCSASPWRSARSSRGWSSASPA